MIRYFYFSIFHFLLLWQWCSLILSSTSSYCVKLQYTPSISLYNITAFIEDYICLPSILSPTLKGNLSSENDILTVFFFFLTVYIQINSGIFVFKLSTAECTIGWQVLFYTFLLSDELCRLNSNSWVVLLSLVFGNIMPKWQVFCTAVNKIGRIIPAEFSCNFRTLSHVIHHWFMYYTHLFCKQDFHSSKYICF